MTSLRNNAQMRRTAGRLTLIAAGFGLALTLSSAFLPFVRFAYRNPSAHVALDAIAAVIALGAAYLLFGRFRERKLVRDALLVYALLVFAFTNIVLAVIPRTAFVEAATLEWTTLIARLVATSALLAAALTTRAVTGVQRSLGRILAFAALATIPLIAASVGALGDIPLGVQPILDPNSTAVPRLEGHPLLLAGQLVLAVLLAVASARFTAQAERGGDAMLRWLGAGTALASLARINYFLFPSIYTSFIYTGDILRLGFYLALLAGASAEVRAYWRRLEADSVERERLISELEELSLVDSLTGLANRRAFFSVGAQQLKVHERTERSVYCVFIDLDDMKGINDRFGHQAGDDALRETATLLRSSFRESEFIARLAGDEFCVLLVEGDPDGPIERLRDALRDREPTAAAPYVLSLSIGVARYDPSQHRAVEDLLAAADRKMYEAKLSSAPR